MKNSWSKHLRCQSPDQYARMSYIAYHTDSASYQTGKRTMRTKEHRRTYYRTSTIPS